MMKFLLILESLRVRLVSNMIRRYLGRGERRDFYTDFNVVVMVMELFDCSSPHDVTISAASQSTLLDRIEECLQERG